MKWTDQILHMRIYVTRLSDRVVNHSILSEERKGKSEEREVCWTVTVVQSKFIPSLM